MIGLYLKDVCNEMEINKFTSLLKEHNIHGILGCDEDKVVLTIEEKDYDKVVRMAALYQIYFEYHYNFAINREGYSIKISW